MRDPLLMMECQKAGGYPADPAEGKLRTTGPMQPCRTPP